MKEFVTNKYFWVVVAASFALGALHHYFGL